MPNVRNILHRKEREPDEGREMRPFTHSMEDFFGNHFPRRWMEGFFDPYASKRPMWGEMGETFEVWPKIDILDKSDSLVVRAEMPGVNKEDLDITIAGDRLTFEAKREIVEEDEKEDFFRSEMAYGRLFRVVHLPVPVVADDAKAELKDGIIEVFLPKVEAIVPHTVKVA